MAICVIFGFLHDGEQYDEATLELNNGQPWRELSE
jgi:hypothetical protein